MAVNQTYAITSQVYMDTIKIVKFAMHHTQIVHDYHLNNRQEMGSAYTITFVQ